MISSRHLVTILLATVVHALLLAMPVMVCWAITRNSLEMRSWREEFYDAGEIPGVEVVERGARFGLQPGTNGNHCDREAWIVYRTELPVAAIEERLVEELGDDGSWWVEVDEQTGLVRADRWLRLDETGADIRCA